MSWLRWVPPVVLALVLAASGGAKLADPHSTRASFRALALPAPGALAVIVPLVELGTAVALIAAPPLGAVIALGLLAAFSVFLASRVARGETEPCACFGQVRRRPISRADLLRNGALMALAVATLALPPA